MIDILSYPFMQRALIAALLTGVIAPAIGTYIVQRRLSLLGDGLGHVAIAGVGLAFLTGFAPVPVAVVVCVAGAVIVEILRQQGKATGVVTTVQFSDATPSATGGVHNIARSNANQIAQEMFGSGTLDVIAGTILYRNLLGQEPDERLVEQLTSLIVDCTLPRSGTSDGRLV